DHADDDGENDGPAADADVADGLTHIFVARDLAITLLIAVVRAAHLRPRSGSRFGCGTKLSVKRCRMVNSVFYRVLMKHIPMRFAGFETWQASPSAQVQERKLLSFSASLSCSW